MFQKILIAEDIDSINFGINALLKEKLKADIKNTKYCDEAVLKVKKAAYENEPFELLITDLSFKEDHRESKIKTGEELIEAVTAVQPDIKIIVYSIEDRPFKIKSLFENYDIDAYINKSRESIFELMEAIDLVYKNSTFISPRLAQLLREEVFQEIEDYDIELIKSLAKGLTQDEISDYFRAAGKSPSSISSIEKRINKLKIFFKAKNAIHLVAISKDMGII